jgi:cytochrome P450
MNETVVSARARLQQLLRRAARKAVRAARRVIGSPAPQAPNVRLTAATIDLDAPAVARDPFPAYDLLRASGNVQFLARHDAWIILGHDELRAAFTMPQLLSNRPYEDVDGVLLAADPPSHTAIRRIASRYFARDVIENVGREIDATARMLLQRAKLDAVREYAEPLSELAAARLIGLDGDTLRDVRAAAANATSFAAYIDALRALAHHASMYDGLRNDGLDEAQARSLVALFWVASTKTTERTIAACAFRLVTDDPVRRELEHDPSAVGTFIDEVLRLQQPEPMLRRLATAPIELGGATIPAGAMVYLSLAAANRDPARYQQPHELRLDRSLDRTTPGHLSFGHGIHYCVGAALARTVVDAAVRALLDARSLRIAQPIDSVRWQAGMMVRFIEQLAIET